MLLQLLSLAVAGFVILILLLPALMVLRLESINGDSPRVLRPLIAVVIGFCAYIALLTAHARIKTVREAERISQRLRKAPSR